LKITNKIPRQNQKKDKKITTFLKYIILNILIDIQIKMGLFSKKSDDEVPKLAELPRLPPIPPMQTQNVTTEQNNFIPNEFNQLPSFPTNQIGEELSQNTIKEAIAGERGDNSASIDSLSTLPALKPKRTLEIEDEEPQGINNILIHAKEPLNIMENEQITASNDPVFIRIDKFEESIKIFQKTKEKTEEIEKMLTDIKKIKEEEGKELDFWENEAQEIKKQIEKINSKLFSKLE